MTRGAQTIRRSIGLAAGLVVTLSAATAASLMMEPDPTWSEALPEAAPEFSTKHLISLEMPAGSSLKLGIAPETIKIGSDGVVRYVVVFQGPAAETAVYEGIRCTSGDHRVYARRNGDQAWQFQPEDWKSLSGTSALKYAWNMARDGICLGASSNRSERDIVRALRSPKGTLYE